MLYFLAGLPRSGSTVLAAILNQHPLLHVTATSGLATLVGNVGYRLKNGPAQNVQGIKEEEHVGILRGMIKGKYDHITKPIVIDKSRTWADPNIIELLSKVLDNPIKIIATVRHVPDCAASFVRIAKPDDLGDFLINSSLINHLQESFIALYEGYKAYPDKFLFVDYDNMINDPSEELSRIHEFLDLPDFDYNLTTIDGTPVKEKDDEVWNIPGLHDIKPVLKRVSLTTSKDTLKHYHSRFLQPEFWKPNFEKHDKVHPLDIELRKAKEGDFKTAREILLQILKDNPDDDRAAYNLGLFYLMDGDLQLGMSYIDRGRKENVFGNRRPITPMQIWDGITPCTVLLNLEGGLGDQIHGARYALDISKRGCRVVVACDSSLFDIIQDIEGVSAVVCHGTGNCVYHNAWLPSMSAVIPLKYTYKELKGDSYINVPKIKKRKKFTIGLRWQGNPAFEHEQNRLFPTKLLFDAVKNFDVDFINLQRDEGSEHIPDWIEKLPLETWTQTKLAVAQCDLVISSCTSIAHLAGAMGIKTYIATPILPYYLWALPGKSTPHYNSVTLFRQAKFGVWDNVFKDIKESLKNDLKLTLKRNKK